MKVLMSLLRREHPLFIGEGLSKITWGIVSPLNSYWLIKFYHISSLLDKNWKRGTKPYNILQPLDHSSPRDGWLDEHLPEDFLMRYRWPKFYLVRLEWKTLWSMVEMQSLESSWLEEGGYISFSLAEFNELPRVE